MKNNPHFRSHYTPVNLICFLCAVILFTSSGRSQTNPFTFGLVKEVKSIIHPIGLLQGDFNGDHVDDIAAYSAKKVRFYYQLADSLGFSTRTLSPTVPISIAASSKINGDDLTDFICLGGKPLRVQVYIMKKRREPFLIWDKDVTGAFDELLVADVNSDAKTDIILYGKRELGILVFRGKGNGTFRSPQVLFAGDSFSDLFVSDVNNDGVNDIIGVQWIENTVALFTGYGNSTFSEPAQIPLRSEPGFIRCGYVNGDDNIDFLVYFPNENECLTYLGDGLGNFTEHQILRISRALSDAAISDINSDRLNDVLLLSADGTLDVHLQSENGFLTDITPFLTTRHPADMELFAHSRTQLKNAAILDSANALIKIMYSAYIDRVKSESREYGLGSSPSEVRAFDLNNDGWNDIIASNPGSRTFSIFINDKTGHYRGQWAIPGAFVPASFYPAGNHTVPWIIFSTEAGSSSLHVIELDQSHYTFNQSKIITQDIPDIIYVSVKSARYETSVLSLGHDPENDQIHLTEIKWRNGGRSAETIINLNLPGKLLGVSSISDARNDRRNIWCTTYDDDSAHLYYVVADSAWNVIEKRLHNTYQTEAPVPTLMWNSDLNNDGRSDCVIFREDSLSGLFIYLGTDLNSPESSAIHVIEDVEVVSSRDLKITDIDKNGNRDIVINNRMRRSLNAYLGNGSGRFSTPVNLAGTARWGGFDISDVDNDGYPEVIMTDSLKCTLNIFSLRDR